MFTEDHKQLLDGPYFAVLGSIGPTGAPHTAPMWYVRDGDGVLMLTRRTSQKALNLDRDPRASVTIDVRDRPYKAVMMDCLAEVVDVDIDSVRLSLARRYLSEQDAQAYVDSRRGADSIAIRFTPLKVNSYP